MTNYFKRLEHSFHILNAYIEKFGEEYELKIYKINNILEKCNIKYDENIDITVNELIKNINIDTLENYDPLNEYDDNLFEGYIIGIEHLLNQLYDYLSNYEQDKKIQEEKKIQKEREKRTDKFEEFVVEEFEKDKEEEERKEAEDKDKINLVEINKKSRKKILVESSITKIGRNLKDNEFLKQQYNTITENKTHIVQLQKTIEEMHDDNKKKIYAAEVEQLEKVNDELITSSLEYIFETNKIQMAIKNLEEPADVLKKEKNYAEDRRDYFNKYSEYLFIISGIFFIFFIIFFYLNYLIEFSLLKEKKIELTIYFLATFPIIFTGLLGLVMVRQANLKSRELGEINKRFILIHEIKQSLRALVEIYRGKDMNNKTEEIIDKLIINILNYASNSSKENENNEILELNAKFDAFSDSLDKKLTFISNILKNNGTPS